MSFIGPRPALVSIQYDDLQGDAKKRLTGGSGTNLNIFPCQALPKDNRFLFLARITPSKGIAEYIKAAEIVINAVEVVLSVSSV